VASNRGLAASDLAGLSLSPSFAQDQTLFVTSPDGHAQISQDAGLTWTAHDAAPEGEAGEEALRAPYERAEIVALTRSPEHVRDGTAYAVTVGQASGGDRTPTLWCTVDRGQRWDRWLELPDVSGGTAVRVAALPANRWGDTVLLGVGGEVYRPRRNAWENRGGARRPVWDAAELPGQDSAGRRPAVTALAASPEYATDRTLFVATSAGVYVSRDGGASFSPWSEGLEPLAAVAVAPSPAYSRDRLVYVLGLGGTIWRRHDS
jgi:hypothetical protein